MTFLGFWFHFGRLLGCKILKKGSQKSVEKSDAFWEAILENKWRGRRQGRRPWGLEFGKNSVKILSTPCSLPLAGGGGSNGLKPPAADPPKDKLEAWILVSGTWLEEFGCLLLMLGGSRGFIFRLLEGLGT